MPELPEVETIVRELRSLMEGQEIKSFVLSEKTLHRSNLNDENAELVGNRISTVSRVGKYIRIDFAESDAVLIIHLGMSGHLATSNYKIEVPHAIFYLRLSNNINLSFSDVRGFGQLHLLSNSEAAAFFVKIAPDALEPYWTSIKFYQKLTGKKTAIKKLLLEQNIISGVGNIYACEALFLAKIHPVTPAKDLTLDQANSLLQAVQKVLLLGIRQGGASIRDYYHASGERGSFQDFINVYNRKNQPCFTQGCSGKIVVEELSGRSTYFCPHCQL